MKTDRDRTIALAGLFQAASLTQQVAQKGVADTAAMEASIQSLFQIDAESVEAVYGGVKGVKAGLQQLCTQISSVNLQNSEIARYVLSLTHLERKLAANPTMMTHISDTIQLTTRRLEHFPMLHSNILAQLGDLYSETISTLKPRIMVNGEPAHLQNPDNANKIRALLLAGIRSTLLWRQCGGRRLQLLFGRGKIVTLAQNLLEALQKEENETTSNTHLL